MTDALAVDLRAPPQQRWTLPRERQDHLEELVEYYTAEMRADARMAREVHDVALPLMPDDYLGELEGLSDATGLPVASLLLVNLYYDLTKTGMACSAFAVNTPSGPIHARNLDWVTDRRLLGETTLVTRFTGAAAGDFVTVGWPGFIGALSGMAPGRFAITLNAAFSPEPFRIARPVVFLIRQVLEEAATFVDAVKRLATARIPCDCLLLVSGTRHGEMVVIERTPTRYALRGPSNGFVAVTNDYHKLAFDLEDDEDMLALTSCGRYDRLCELTATKPADADGCLDYLSDPAVMMDITLQQMVFQANTGLCRAKPVV